MKRYSVYELRGDDERSWIGEIQAQSESQAHNIAHGTFGAPIEVEPTDPE